MSIPSHEGIFKKISENILTIKQKEKDLCQQRESLNICLQQEDMEAIEEVRLSSQEKMRTLCKERQKKKFDLLLSFRNYRQGKHKEDEETDKWVKNCSSRSLTTDEQNVLKKGLNFAPAPRKIPVPAIIASVEDGLRKTRSGNAQMARIDIVGVLRKTRIPESNLTPNESRAIKNLQRDNTIIILPADKGRMTVVLDKTDYEGKIESMLSDQNTYKKLSQDPAPSLERKMNNFLLNLKKSGLLTPSLYYRLRSSARKTPQLYGLPKVHKEGIPLRPIVSFVNSPTYELSKFLVTLLSPLVGKSTSHTSNSFEFASFVRQQLLTEGMVLVSFDVISLFTNIPVNRAADIAYDHLLSDQTLDERTNLSPDDIKKLLLLCLNATYLSYKKDYYQQTFGTAMGSSVSVVVVNLVMEDVEKRALATYHSPPVF